jgi:hypothetical protein
MLKDKWSLITGMALKAQVIDPLVGLEHAIGPGRCAVPRSVCREARDSYRMSFFLLLRDDETYSASLPSEIGGRRHIDLSPSQPEGVFEDYCGYCGSMCKLHHSWHALSLPSSFGLRPDDR